MSETNGYPDTDHAFLMSHLPDGRTLLDFQRLVGHLILTDEQALALAEALVENVRAAHSGNLILPDKAPFVGRDN